jgi:hypothetical protein
MGGRKGSSVPKMKNQLLIPARNSSGEEVLSPENLFSFCGTRGELLFWAAECTSMLKRKRKRGGESRGRKADRSRNHVMNALYNSNTNRC